MKHILFLWWKDKTHPHAWGAENVLHQYMEGLVAAWYKVSCLTSAYPWSKAFEIIHGVEIYRKYSINTIYFFAWIWVNQFKKQYKIDLIVDEAGWIPFLSPLYVRKTPILFFIHHIGDKERDSAFPFYIGKIFKQIYFLILKLYKDLPSLAVSDSTRSELIEKFNFDRSKVRIIENALEIEVADCVDFEKKQKIIFFLGRLTPIKRVDHAILAFNALYKSDKEYRLIIAGNDQDKKYLQSLKELVSGLGLEDCVEFAWQISVEQKNIYSQISEVMLVPSVKEGFWLTVLDANAYWLPVIAYNVSGLKDSVKPWINGYLIEDWRYDLMWQQLIKLVDDKKEYKRVSESALSHMKELKGVKEKNQEFVSLIKDLL